MLSLTPLLAILMLLSVGTAFAQPASIDRDYEAQKASEISTARLQLATQPGSAAIQELHEAEDTLRRLKGTKAPDQRRKIAAELELAIAHLKIAANGMRQK